MSTMHILRTYTTERVRAWCSAAMKQADKPLFSHEYGPRAAPNSLNWRLQTQRTENRERRSTRSTDRVRVVYDAFVLALKQ